MSAEMHFVVIYRWRVKRGREEEFVAAWTRVTCAIRDACGSGGSALFNDDDGSHVAIARWPDREARDRCSAAAAADVAILEACAEERFPERRLTTLVDLWTPPPPS